MWPKRNPTLSELTGPKAAPLEQKGDPMTDWGDAALKAMSNLNDYVVHWKQRAEAAETTVADQKTRLRLCIEARDRALARVLELERELETAVQMTQRATAAVAAQIDEINRASAAALAVARPPKLPGA